MAGQTTSAKVFHELRWTIFGSALSDYARHGKSRDPAAPEPSEAVAQHCATARDNCSDVGLWPDPPVNSIYQDGQELGYESSHACLSHVRNPIGPLRVELRRMAASKFRPDAEEPPPSFKGPVRVKGGLHKYLVVPFGFFYSLKAGSGSGGAAAYICSQ